MKILFILASDSIYRYNNIFTVNNGFTPLSLITLAACVPQKYNAYIEIVDEGMQKINYDKKEFDIVAISCCASSSNRAYQLSEYWQKRGAYTVIGGVHATLCPEDVKKHCNSVMVGYGEKTFPEFLEDYVNHTTKRIYKATYENNYLSSPIPRRDLLNNRYYFKNTIVANRGCSNKCKFCSINKFSNGIGIKRSLNEVIDELKKEKFKKVYFLDPSPISDIEYAKEFFNALIPLKIKYFIDMTINVAEDDEILDLLQKSGCFEILVGFESFNANNLLSQDKKFNRIDKYKEYVQKIHDKSISILGSFVIGMNNDTKENLQILPDLVKEINVDLPRYTVYTPFPGTEPYLEYKNNNRLITDNYDYYDLMHVVHKPKLITPEDLQKSLYDIWQKSFSLKYITERFKIFPTNKYDLLLQNLYFKHLGKKIPKKIEY